MELGFFVWAIWISPSLVLLCLVMHLYNWLVDEMLRNFEITGLFEGLLMSLQSKKAHVLKVGVQEKALHPEHLPKFP